MKQTCNIIKKNLIVHLQEIDSTNLYIKRNLADFEEFNAVYTDYQNAGRGQSGNRWESEKGKNIMFSMLFKPRCGIELQYLLLYYVAHQVAEFIRGQIELKSLVRIKYPNDVMFVMVSYVPIPSKVGEMKTKPTQYAVRTLNSAGILPDFIVARSETYLDQKRKEKTIKIIRLL